MTETALRQAQGERLTQYPKGIFMANLDLKATLELIDKMSQPLKAISSQATKMQKDISNSTKELQKMQSTLNKTNQFSSLVDNLAKVKQQLKEVSAQEKALKKSIEATGTPTKKQSRELANLSAMLAKLQATKAKYETSLTGLGSSIKDAGYSTKNLAKTQAELASKMAQANTAITQQRAKLEQLQKSQKRAQNLKDLGDKMQGGGMRTATAGAGALYAMSKPINEAKHFETETARVASLGLGEASTKDAVEFAKNMKTYGTSITDNLTLVRDGMTAFADEHHAQMVAPMLAKMKFANEAMYGEGQGHENERKLMDMLKVIEIRGGTKSEGAFNEQANLIQQVITATGGRVQADQWMDTIKTGGIAAKQMDNKAFYQTLEPLVQEMGGGSVGHGLMSAYQNLYQGRTSKRAAQNLDKLGLIGDPTKVKYDKAGQTAQLDIGALKGADLFKKNQFDWMEKVLLPQLNEHGLTSDTQIIDAIGSIFTNRKAADLMANMYMQRAQIHKSQDFNAGADNIDQLNEKAKGTARGKELDALAKTHNAYLELGNSVLPIYTKALEMATTAMQGLTNIMWEYPNLTKGIAIGLALIAGGMLVFGGLAVIIGSVLAPLALLRMAIMNLGGMGNILRGLIAPFKLLWNALGLVGKMGLWAGEMVIRALMGIGTAILRVGAFMMANPITIAIALLAAAAYLIYKNWAPIKEFFINIWNSIKTGAESAWTAVVAKFNEMYNSVSNTASNLWESIKSSFSSGVENASAIVSALPARIKGFFTGLIGDMTSIGGDIMAGLANGITGGISSAVGAALSAASAIKSAFTGVKGIDSHSPSKVFTRYGDYIMQGLHQGITTNDSPVSAIMRTSDNIRSAMDTSAIRFDTRPSIRAGLATTGANTSPAPITINVYASAGQSVKDIARQVASELARTGQAQTANNTALYDLPDQWG